MNLETIKKLNTLPPHLKKDVLDYIDFLTQKYRLSSSGESFRFDWEGGLSDLTNKYNSVELQHKAMEWR